MTARSRRTVALVGAAVTLGATVGCTAADPDGSAGEPTGTPRATSAPLSPRATEHTSEEPTGHPSRSGVEQATLDRRLIAAAWDNDLALARRLVARGADVNAKDETEQSAFLIATSEGYPELLDLTLRHGAEVNSKDSFNGTGLIRGAERGHAAVVGRLVRAGVSLDHVNDLGWTALHEAIILGDGSQRYLDTVRVLVGAGADVRLPSARDGVTPMQQATSKGHDAIADLLEAASRVDATRHSIGPGVRGSAESRLLDAAAAGDADDVALALRAGAGLEARDDLRRTPLLLASTHDRVGAARLLVALGADPDARDVRHDTPWLVTGVTGSVAMLEALLPAKPDLTIRNRYGGVSVIPASERGHVAYVRRVVRTGIDVNHVNDLGWTALLEAVVLGDGSKPYRQIVRQLLAAGADPSIADHDGITAWEHAEARGQRAVARILHHAT